MIRSREEKGVTDLLLVDRQMWAMEDIYKQGEHGLLKIRILIEELKEKGADTGLCDELDNEARRAIEDIVRMIDRSKNDKKIVIREFARFVEIPWGSNDTARFARVVAISMKLGEMRGKIRGVYRISWNQKHNMNITGECMTATVNVENTMISAMIALVAASEAMGIKWLAVFMDNQDMYECLKEGEFPQDRFCGHLIEEVKRIQSESRITWKMITEAYMERIEAQYGKIKHPSDQPILVPAKRVRFLDQNK